MGKEATAKNRHPKQIQTYLDKLGLGTLGFLFVIINLIEPQIKDC